MPELNLGFISQSEPGSWSTEVSNMLDSASEAVAKVLTARDRIAFEQGRIGGVTGTTPQHVDLQPVANGTDWLTVGLVVLAGLLIWRSAT